MGVTKPLLFLLHFASSIGSFVVEMSSSSTSTIAGRLTSPVLSKDIHLLYPSDSASALPGNEFSQDPDSLELEPSVAPFPSSSQQVVCETRVHGCEPAHCSRRVFWRSPETVQIGDDQRLAHHQQWK